MSLQKIIWVSKSSSNKSWLSTMTGIIREALDKDEYSCGAFLDFHLTLKAFDTVNHEILIAKLNHCGVRGIYLDWFKS